MANAARALREALDAHRRAASARALGRWRSAEAEPVSREAARLARWLRSESAHEALVEAAGSGELGPGATARMRMQLGWLVRDETLESHDARLRELIAACSGPSGEPLRLSDALARLSRADDAGARRGLARELESGLSAAGEAARAGHMAAEALMLERYRELGGEVPDPWALEPATREALVAMLADTDEAMREALEWALRGLGRGQPSWDALLRALRAPHLDSVAGARTRWRRIAAPFAAPDFNHALMHRMRAEPLAAAATPLCEVRCMAAPGDVRVAQVAVDHGIASDVLAAEGLGRGLALALQLPSAPAEDRWPLGVSIEGALGALSMQLWADRLQLSRVQGMAAAEAERVGRLAATLVLAWLRIAAALALIDDEAARLPAARDAAIEAALGAALGAGVAPPIASLAGADLVQARVRARDVLVGLCWHVALRERHDDDWCRDPRSAEGIVGAAVRGNRLGPLALCAELGVELPAATARILELLA